MKNRVALPDLNTTIALYGRESRDELSGPPCVALIIGIIVGEP